MKQVIHYIVHKCQYKPTFGKTVLYKIMYFSDFNHYELYETLITNETYTKRRLGPTPDSFDECFNELKQENKVDSQELPVHDYKRVKYFSLEEPDTSLLNNKEVDVIDSAIDNYSHMNATQISDYSHGDKPWRVAGFRESLDPEFVFYRDEEYSVREYDD